MPEGAAQFEYGKGLEAKAWAGLADDLPVVGKAGISSLNLFYSFCRPVEFELENRTYTLLFQPGAAPGTRARNKKGTIVEVSVGSDSVCIHIEHLAFLDMFRLPQARHLPEELYIALLETCLQPLLDRFEAFSGMPVSIAGVRHNAQADVGGCDIRQNAELDITFEMIRADNQALIEGCICLTLALLRRFGRLLAVHPAAIDDSLLHPVLFKLAFVLGQTALQLHDLRRLRPGDVVLVDAGRDDFLKGDIMIRAPDGSFWRGRVTGSILEVNSELESRPMENTTETQNELEQTEAQESPELDDEEGDEALSEEMESDDEYEYPEQEDDEYPEQEDDEDLEEEDDEDLEQEDDEDLPQPYNPDLHRQDDTFGRLPVNIVFELDRKTITLGEMKTIKPGYTFELSKELQKPVRVTANGRFFGRGELVRIDNRLGVRLLELKY